MNTAMVDDCVLDLQETIERFKEAPSEDTLDDVYRATMAIESACKEQLQKLSQQPAEG